MGLFRFGFAVLAGAVLTSAAACSHAPPPAAPAGAPPAPPGACAAPEPVRVTLLATPQLNPGDKGEALAVVVRLYQLKGTSKLTGAAFDDLLDRDKDTLGDDLLAVNEVTINPGERLDPPVLRKSEATYLAAVALFRRPAGTTWRAAKRLAPPEPMHCHAGDRAKGSPPVAVPIRFMLDENRIDLR